MVFQVFMTICRFLHFTYTPGEKRLQDTEKSVSYEGAGGGKIFLAIQKRVINFSLSKMKISQINPINSIEEQKSLQRLAIFPVQ
jgi:hypothetical protein